MIKEFILLPMLLSAFERDARRIAAAVKTPGPYAEFMQATLDRITRDLTAIRRQFRMRGIKVYDPQITSAGIRAEFKCRGYLSEFGILNNVLKAEAETYMRKYLNGSAEDVPGGVLTALSDNLEAQLGTQPAGPGGHAGPQDGRLLLNSVNVGGDRPERMEPNGPESSYSPEKTPF